MKTNLPLSNFIQLIALGIILFWNNSLLAQPNATQELTAKLNHIQTLQANFTQTLSNNQGAVLQRSTGQVYLQRPGKFRWQTNNPNQLLVADGHYVWIYDIDLQQVTRQRLNTRQNATPAALLSGAVQDLQRQFVVTRLSQPGGFSLKPKSANDTFQTVQLQFKGSTLVALRLVDKLGQINVLRFTQVRLNPSLSPTLFRFKAPAGVDVVRQ